MRLLYVLASYVLFAVLLPVLSVYRKTRHGLLQRLGFYSAGTLPPGSGPMLWLHGASAGDLLALSPMFGPLRERFPGCRILLSTTTNTGYLMARERLAKQIDGVVYAPYDLWGATRRAVRAIQPELLVLEYTEIWPNLIRAAKRNGARVVLTNGRFSPKNLGKYRLFFSLIGNPLRELDLFLMRHEEEAERARSLGAPGERVWVTGNTKFDSLAAAPAKEDEALRRALGLPEGALVLMAGSTHEGEEEHVLAVYRRLREERPELRLVIAPRYIDRASRIAGLARDAGLTVGLRSGENREGGQVVVLDTIGELARAYRLATVVFVGGSFTKRGGQNILEPAGQGKPVLYGPHMDNFRDSVQVLEGRGGIQVRDAEELFQRLRELLADSEKRGRLGEAARATVSEISGASRRNVEQMAKLWAGAPSSLVIHPHFHRRYTGVTRHVESVVPELARAMEVRAIGTHLGPTVQRIPWGELLHRLRTEPMVWHAHRNNELLVGLLLRLLGWRLKVVFTRHTSKAPSTYTRWLARRADALVALTSEVAEAMALPSTMVPHGIDLSRFQPPTDREEAWRKLGLGGRYGIGVVGRIRKEKGQGDFIEALRPLVPHHPEWKAVLVGLAKGAEQQWVESLTAGLGDRLVLAGEQAVIQPWYQGLSVLVHPSYLEGYSLVHVEAMASGCCVVASRLKYLDTLIEHGRTGFFFEPGDVSGLREVLEMLMRDPERARQVGRNAAEHARSRCGIEHEAQALRELYQSLLAPGPPR